MIKSIDIVLLVIILFFIYIKPHFIIDLSNSIIGKLIFIILLIIISYHSIFAGIAFAFLIIIYSEQLKEGFENNGETKKETNMEEKPNTDEKESDTENEDNTHEKKSNIKNDNDNSITLFREKHCSARDNTKILLDDNDKEVSMDNIKKSFPTLSFINEQCDPCEESCEFKITESEERLNVEEQLRPKESK